MCEILNLKYGWQQNSPIGWFKPTVCLLFLFVEMWRLDFSRSRNTNCLLWVAIHRQRCELAHTLNLELLGYKCVVACRSAVIPGLLWHLSVSFVFSASFIYSFFLAIVVLFSPLLFNSPLPSRLCSPLSLDTCHYPVLNVPSAYKTCPLALLSWPVCACVWLKGLCVQLHWSACARVSLCVSSCVSHPVNWKTMCKWRLQSNSNTGSAGWSLQHSLSLSCFVDVSVALGYVCPWLQVCPCLSMTFQRP